MKQSELLERLSKEKPAHEKDEIDEALRRGYSVKQIIRALTHEMKDTEMRQGKYIVRSVVEAGRNFQDPRSKRKMAKELVQAAVMADEILSPILVNGNPTKEWEYEDRQRVCIMR